MRGFTLIEVLIVVGFVAIISLTSVAFLSRFFTQNAVANTVDQLTAELRKAQMYAMTGKQNGNWGVHKGTNEIVLFKGDSYATRNTAFDEKFAVNANISITGLTDIIFTRMTGTPSASATITVAGGGNTKVIDMNDQGVVGGGESAALWYNTSYLYKKKITIDRTKVSGGADLSNFPVLISITDANLRTVANGGSVQNNSGFDIIFTDSTETTKLDHEIEKYVPTTGELQIWVRVPTLSVSSDTVLYVYYNNSSISSSQENKTTVWDSNYVGVWHLKETPTATCLTTKEVCDSTANANNADAGGTWSAGQQVAGKINGALDFSGDDYLNAVDSASLDTISSALTASLWVKGDTFDTTYRRIISRDANPNQRWFMEMDGFTGNTGKVLFVGDNTETTKITSTTTLTAGTWYYLVMTVNATNNTAYINGTQNVQGAGTASLGIVGDIGIGADPTGVAPFWDGIIDEVRLSKVVRSAGWIATEYNNQNTPSTFYSIGSQTGQ